MDRKSIIILVVSLLLLMAWGPLTNWIYPPKPLPGTNLVSHASNTVSSTNFGTNTPVISSAASNLAPVVAVTPNAPPAEEHTLKVESTDASYTFT